MNELRTGVMLSEWRLLYKTSRLNCSTNGTG